MNFQMGFWHPFGPHGGENVVEILARKQREINANGWTLWSFQRRLMLKDWMREIRLACPARQGAGAANATINRELATLSRMLRLAYRNGKLLRLPSIEKLKEAAPRQGFFERDRYEAVRRHLRPDLQVVATLEHAFGWRAQSEVLPLEIRQLDLEAGTLRLDAGRTKNDDADSST